MPEREIPRRAADRGRGRATPQPAGRGPRGGAGSRGGPRAGGSQGPRGRVRAQLSLDAVLGGAIELLDTEGETGLTFRGLAARLGGGVGSLYWYVRSKEQLISLATDAIVGRAADEVEAAHLPVTDDIDDRLASLRLMGTTLFTHLDAHPWAATMMLRSTDVESNSLRFFELAGQQLMPLGLTKIQLFHGISAFMNYVIGTAGQMAYQDTPGDPSDPPPSQQEFFDDMLERWSHLDKCDYPFAQLITDVLRDHDDVLQFTAGLDLLLDGLRRQAEAAR